MEKILFLAHTEADGTLSNTSLESLTAAVELKQALSAEFIAGLYGASVEQAVNAIASCGAQRFLAALRRIFRLRALCHRRCCLRSPDTRLGIDYRDRRLHIAQRTRAGRRRAASRRLHRHARHLHRLRCQCSGNHALVLPTAH